MISLNFALLMLVQAPKFVPICMEHQHTLHLLSVLMVLHRWGRNQLPAVVVVVKDASDAGAAAHFVWGCESGGVPTKYLLSLAGMPFNSGGVSVCNSACIEPAVVQRVACGGESSDCRRRWRLGAHNRLGIARNVAVNAQEVRTFEGFEAKAIK